MKTNKTNRRALLLAAGLLTMATSVAAGQGGDDHGDTCETATLVASGVPVQGVMGNWPDEDWFAFDAVEGNLYIVELHWLYDSYPNPGGTINLPSCGGEFLEFTPTLNFDQPEAVFIAPETGRFTLALDWTGMYPGGPYELIVTDEGPQVDDHANGQAEGTPISADGTEVHARIDYVRDVDYFRVELAGGMLYSLDIRSEFTCKGEPPSVYVILQSIGSDRTWAHASNSQGWDCAPQPFTSRTFAIPAERAGEYAVGVGAIDPGVWGAGAYTLRIRPFGALPADDHANDCDHASPLQPLPDPAPVNGTCYSDLDVDWFVFDAATGRSYEFEFDGWLYESLKFEVFAPGCTEAIGEGRQWRDNTFAFICPEAGRYSIRVSFEWQTAAVSGYTVRVTDYGEVPDDHGNGHSSSTPMTADGTWMTGRIDHGADQDVFRVSVAANTVYAMEIENLAGCVQLFAYLEGDPSGGAAQAIGEPTDPACGYGHYYSPITWFFVGAGHAGERFMRVWTWNQPDQTADYRVRVFPVWNPEGDEHGDSCDDSEVVHADGSVMPGMLNSKGDVDSFRFEAQAGRLYRVALEFAPDDIYSMAYFPDAGGEPACNAQAREWGATPIFASRSGWYSLRISGSVIGDGTPYSLRVIDAGPATDDYPDASWAAPWMSTDGTLTAGVVNFPGDVDYLRVRLFAHNTYRFRLRALTACASVDADLGYLSRLFTTWVPPCEDGSDVSRSFYVPAYDGGETTIRVTAYVSDTAGYEVSVELLSCSADITADGRLDSLDFFLFLNLLMSGSGDGDINSDGNTNTQDLFDFLVMFFNGCPA